MFSDNIQTRHYLGLDWNWNNGGGPSFGALEPAGAPPKEKLFEDGGFDAAPKVKVFVDEGAVAPKLKFGVKLN